MAALSYSLPFAPTLNGALRRMPTWAVYLAGTLPLAWILWLLMQNGLGVDPVKEIEHRLGKIGLQFIVGGLAITPLRRFGGLNLMRFRRAVGVLAFSYVTLHLMAWVVLDMALLWQQALSDIVKRPYLTVGMAGFALLVPLAATSNDWALRRLGGARWRRLHRLVYPAALLGGAHYLWLVKAWPPQPFVYLGAILVLLALRLRR
jgi:sulfoxide reductase heme-binding subunit YedZ